MVKFVSVDKSISVECQFVCKNSETKKFVPLILQLIYNHDNVVFKFFYEYHLPT